MKYHFFAYMARMKYIKRWGLMNSSKEENIQEHSLQTAMIAHALALLGNKRLGKEYNADRAAVLGIYHDMPEIITGDMPTPVKYYSPEIRDAYKRVEAVAADRLLDMLPEELRESYEPLLKEEDPEVRRFVKAADKLSAHIKCLEELKASNHEFILAARQTRQALDDMDMPEVRYFIENFLDSFTLTLDELK